LNLKRLFTYTYLIHLRWKEPFSSKKVDKVHKPVYYVSKVLSEPKTCYPTIERLALALVTVARKLRPDFLSYPIVVQTNHKLKSILLKPNVSGRGKASTRASPSCSRRPSPAPSFVASSKAASLLKARRLLDLNKTIEKASSHRALNEYMTASKESSVSKPLSFAPSFLVKTGPSLTKVPNFKGIPAKMTDLAIGTRPSYNTKKRKKSIDSPSPPSLRPCRSSIRASFARYDMLPQCRPTTLHAYCVFARRSLPVVPSSPLAVWAGCPSLRRSVRLFVLLDRLKMLELSSPRCFTLSLSRT
ncbi:hypothetical protein ACH5RR_013275, partial [Cinchona calisaya]